MLRNTYHQSGEAPAQHHLDVRLHVLIVQALGPLHKHGERRNIELSDLVDEEVEVF